MPAADVACPVCRKWNPGQNDPGAEDAACRGCGWLLFSGYRLGSLTPELAQAFDDGLRAAIRNRDIAAVAAATGGLTATQSSLTRQIAALARSGPVTAAELSVVSSPAAAATGSSAVQAARQLAGRNNGQVCPVVVEIGVTGISARTFSPDGRWEDAWLDAWPWAEIIDHLPAEVAARRFWLAGGVGDGLPPDADLAGLARGWAERAVAGRPALAVLVQQRGWAVLDLFAAELARASATPVELGLPPTVPPTARRLDTDIAAASVARTPDGGVIAAIGDYDGQVRLRAVVGPADRQLDEPGQELRWFRSAMTALALAPDLDAVAAGARDGSVWLRAREPAAAPRQLTAHAGRVAAIGFSPGVVVSLGSEGGLHSVPLTAAVPDPDGKIVVDLGGSGATALAVAARARLAVAGGTDGVLRLVELVSGERADLPSLGLSVTSLAIDDAGRLLAAGLADGSVRLLDLPTRTWLARFELDPGSAGPMCIAAADGQPVRLAMSSARGGIYYWTGAADGEGTMTELGVHQGGVRELGLPGLGVVSIGREDRVLRRWSPPGGDGAGSSGGAR
jgi:WD40 repeat protein